MGVQILLLIFAAVTLGGLGTAFGALVGSLIVGLLVEVSTLWIPSDLKYVGALVVLIVILLVPTTGHPGSQRENRLGGTMDWGQIFSNTAYWSLQPDDDRATRSRRSASRCTSATPACSTSAWPASWPSAPTATRSRSSRFGLPVVGRRPRRLSSPSVVFALILGIPTLRLRADYLAIVTIAAAEIVRLLLHDELVRRRHGLGGRPAAGTTAASARRSTRCRRGHSYGFGPWQYNADELVGAHRRHRSCSRSRVFLVWLLMRSPWGRVLKGIREDEDAVRALGKNVFSYKMQALILGGVFGALGGHRLRAAPAVVPATYATSLTFFIWTILLLGGAATIFGPVVGSVHLLGAAWPSSTTCCRRSPQAGCRDHLAASRPARSGSSSSASRSCCIVIFRPQGILGNKKELTFVK